MAVQAKVIKQKIKGVGNIRKITRTMEMASVSKMKKATSHALSLREYRFESESLVQNLLKKTETQTLYSKKKKEINKKLIILVGSNKGLCGSYNTNIYRALSKKVKEEKATLEIITVGKQAEKIARRLELGVTASFVEWGDVISFEDTQPLIDIVLKSFASDKYDSVEILYTEYIKAMNYRVNSKSLLPIENLVSGDLEIIKKIQTDIVVEPNESEVLSVIVPRVIHAVVHSSILESFASEHSSRMFAMNTATENAKEMLRTLTITYNRARQDAVTQELAEIAAGAGATTK